MKSLKAEKTDLTAKKDALYAKYSDARAKYHEIRNADENVKKMYGPQIARVISRAAERSSLA